MVGASQAFLCKVLRGGTCEWPWPGEESAAQAFLDSAASHHVESLVAFRIRGLAETERWPASVVRSLNKRLRDCAVREALVQRELAAVHDASERAGVPLVLTKGSALAYTVYPSPSLRPRGDTDVFIRRADLDAVSSRLAELGYRRTNGLRGERVTHQALFRKTDRHGLVHDLDVHWRISNRPLFENLVTWNEAEAACIPIPALGAHARALGPIHALTLACVHPVAHHGHSPAARLRWVYDVHLLATRMTTAEFAQWADHVAARQVRAICLRALQQARWHFDTEIPRSVTEALENAPAEESARYLTAGPWRGDVRLSDLRTSQGLAAKAQLLREVLVPETAYMREAYGFSSRAPLACLYLHRAVRGSWRILWRFVS